MARLAIRCTKRWNHNLGLENLEARRVLDSAGPFDFETTPAIEHDFDSQDQPLAVTASSFESLEPDGSLAFESQFSGDIFAPNAVEKISLALKGQQTISVIVHPESALRPKIVIRNSSTTFAVQTAPAAGEVALVQSILIPSTGEYFVDISGQSGTTGTYEGVILFNGAFEEEPFDNSNNNASTNAQDIGADFVAMGGGAERAFLHGYREPDFEDDFESGVLDESWTTTSTQPAGRIQIGSQFPAAEGQNFLMLDRSGIGANNLNEAIWTVDLSSVTAATLNFSHVRFADEQQTLPASFTGSVDGDGVSVSSDGTEWHTILNAPQSANQQWQNFSLDLVQFANGQGITLNSNFQIKFQQFDNGPHPLDGRGFDSIRIDTTPPAVQEDWYQLSAVAGQDFSVALGDLNTSLATGIIDSQISIFDSSLQKLATGQNVGNANKIISNFRATTAGNYFVQVVGPPEEYGLLVTKQTSFDAETNSSLSAAQDINPTLSTLGFVSDQAGASLNLLSTMEGPGFNGLIPPDPTLAVGPEHVVASVNSDIAIYDKATGQLLFTQSFVGANGFFGDVGSTSTAFDPWLLYDTDSERFFFVAIDTESDTVANLYLAVSTTSTPSNGTEWHKYMFNYAHNPEPLGLGTGLHFADYEKIGVNDDAIFVSGNYFPISSGTGVYAGITAFEKTALINGDPINVLYEEFFDGFSVFPLHQYDSGSTQYFAESPDDNFIRIHAVTDVNASPTRSTFDIAIPEIAQPVNVPQLGGATPAEAIDTRIMTGVWRNGSAWFGHPIIDPATSAGETVARWYEVQTNNFPTNDPVLVQSGNVEPGPSVYTFMPAIAVDGNNNMAIGFSIGGPNQFLGAAFTGRLSTDPPGTTIGSFVEYAPGLASYQRLGGTRNRWGDYTGMAIDPVDDTTFWAFNSFASAGNTWDTRIASFQVDPKPDADVYEFEVVGGDNLTIETFTPFDSAGDEFDNAPDLEIELFGPNDVLITSNLNSAADGRNAVITHNNAAAGTHKVRIRPTSGTGTYRLDVAGATGVDPQPTIIASTPSSGLQLAEFPQTFTVVATEPIDFSSVDLTDFVLTDPNTNLFNAIDFEVNGNEIIFTIDSAANTGDGQYSIFIAASNLQDYQGNNLSSNFLADFTLDTIGITVLSTTWNGNALPVNKKLNPGPLTFDALLSETPFRLASARRGIFAPGTDDILLTNNTSNENIAESLIDVDTNANTFSATYSDLPESNYTLRLLSGPGAFEDLAGNSLDGEFNNGTTDGTPTGNGVPGGDYVISFDVDITTQDVNPFERIEPLGSFVSESLDNTGFLNNATDSDDFRFFAHQGEKISALAQVDQSITGTLEIVGVGSSATNANAGEPVILSPQTIPQDGFYSIRFSGSASSNFSIDIFKNMVTESFIGESSSANPISIDDSFVDLGTGRYAVRGSILSDVEFVQFNDPTNSLFIDISNVGTPFALDDDGEIAVASGIKNQIFDASFFTLGNNGAIAEDPNVNIFFQNIFIPALDIPTAIFPYWDDLAVSNDSVYVHTDSINGIPALIIQWEQMPHFDNPGTITFQMQLLSSGPVLTRFVYPDVIFGDPALDKGATATIGFQNVDDGRAIEYSLNQPILSNGDVIELRTLAEEEVYSIDFSGKIGNSIDVLVTGIDETFENEILQLIDPLGNVVSTAPIQPGHTNFDLGILGHTIQNIGDNVYTIRLESKVGGDYTLVVTDNLAFEPEPNGQADPARLLTDGSKLIGYLDANNDTQDFFQLDLATGSSLLLTTQTPFDTSSGQPLNSVNPRLELLSSDKQTVLASDSNSADGKNAQIAFNVTQTGTYFVKVESEAGNGEYSLDVQASGGDTTVSSVRIASTSWQPGFTQFIDPSMQLGYEVVAGSQFGILPWFKMNRIYLEFSGPVTINPGDVELFGVNVPDYSSQLDTVTFNPVNNIATIPLKPGFEFGADKLLVRVNSTVLDENNIPIDEFKFRMNVLPGDADRNTLVSTSDITVVRFARLEFLGTQDYTIFSDVDGSTLINTGDITLVRSKRLTFLPSGQPSPPATAVAASLPESDVGAAVDAIWNDNEQFDFDDDNLAVAGSLLGLRRS